jgi:hypothetical protein
MLIAEWILSIFGFSFIANSSFLLDVPTWVYLGDSCRYGSKVYRSEPTRQLGTGNKGN